MMSHPLGRIRPRDCPRAVVTAAGTATTYVRGDDMAQGTCIEDGCEEPVSVKSRGLCNTHYIWARNHGFLSYSYVPRTLAEECWSRIVKQPNGCWHWIGFISNDGYGKFSSTLAHRLVYELLVGPIARGHWVDHQCHNWDLDCTAGPGCLHRRCVNPAHLEAVLPVVNLRRGLSERKLACVHGHPYDEANTKITANGHRQCRRCACDYERRKREERKRAQ